MDADQKFCNGCETPLHISLFGERIVAGKRYPRTKCKTCFNRAVHAHQKENGTRKRRDAVYAEREKVSRASGQDRSKWVVRDSRGADAKKGRANDLTYEAASRLLGSPCSYCGDAEGAMTLDRIDNAIGHLQSNVVPACYRCNMIRRDMPYDAWLHLIPGLRKARELGAFKGWVGGRRKTLCRSSANYARAATDCEDQGDVLGLAPIFRSGRPLLDRSPRPPYRRPRAYFVRGTV